MNVLLSLSLWLALLMPSCCGNVGSHEEESTTDNYDYLTEATATPDYDYNATFDYYIMTGLYVSEDKDKAAGIGPLIPVLLLGLVVHHIWN